MARTSSREKTTASETESEAEDSDFKPLTAQEAMEWRKRQPRLSVWRIVAVQAVVGVLAALLALLLTGRAQWAWSVGYGALSVVVPAALFARAMARRRTSAGAAVAGSLRLGAGEDCCDRRHAGGGAQASAGAQLAGLAGRHGGNDESVLGSRCWRGPVSDELIDI
ncbi:ATP synthase subunit I [Alicycliphilus sp. B1]|nr:ATP synthase subunit I [Alicycliphilus sp. B1]